MRGIERGGWFMLAPHPRPLSPTTEAAVPGRGEKELTHPHSTTRPSLDHATARRTSDVLLPPKPNELETATDTGWLIA